MRITVLLSTYNGDIFLKEQLDSLLNQTHGDFNVYIRDDGSTDNTVSIIKEYCLGDERFHFLESNDNLGCAASFLKLLSYVKSDIYMFCDQDDIWLKDKIKRVYEHFSKLDNNETPHLYHTDLTVVNEKLDVISDSFLQHQSMNAYGSMKKNNLYIQNFIVGCTTAINSTLAEKVLSSYKLNHNIAMHDWWIGLTAKCFGEIFFDDTKTILYRQHGGNVLGAQPNTFRRFIQSFKTGTGLNRVGKFRSVVTRQAESFKVAFSEELTEDTKRKLELLVEGIGENATCISFIRCYRHGIYMQGLKRNLAIIYSIMRQKKLD